MIYLFLLIVKSENIENFGMSLENMMEINEQQYIIANLCLIGMFTLGGALTVSLLASGLEHLFWKYMEWKSKTQK